MDIYKSWEQLEAKNFSNQIQKENIMKAIQLESTSTVAELKKKLKHKMNWCLLFISAFTLAMLWSYSNLELVMIWGLINAIYIIGYFMLRKAYLKMESAIQYDGALLTTLKNNRNSMHKALDYEQVVFILFLPFIIIAASLIHPVSNGVTILEAFNQGFVLKKIILSTVFGLPLVYFLGKYMNNKAYGKHLKDLEKNITQLEELH